MKDPDGLSGRYAQEAVRKVHAEEEVPPEAPMLVRPDPKVPGANFVEGPPTGRYWVGLAGEVHRTSTASVPQTRSGEYTQARTRYTGAVERVRLHYSTPVVEELFAVPDTHVPGAFFVYDVSRAQTVRWVSPDGDVHDGYREVDGQPQWDERTVEVRREALRSRAGTAGFADD